MDTRNNSTLIPIPSIVDDARWIGRFSREVRKSITALRDRRQVMTKMPNLNYLHPFKLFTLDTATERRLYVAAGRVTMMQWDNTAYPKMSEAVVTFNSGKLYNDEFSLLATNGYLALGNSKTYGIWIEIEWVKKIFSNIVSAVPVFNGPIHEIQAINGVTGGAIVRTSETYTDPDDGIAFADSELQNAMIYIGKVETDANGLAKISQYLRSDLVIPIVIGTDPFISEEPVFGEPNNNILVLGDDDGLYVPPPPQISGDADNAIQIGSDNGWYVDANDPFISSDSPNNLGIGTDGGWLVP